MVSRLVRCYSSGTVNSDVVTMNWLNVVSHLNLMVKWDTGRSLSVIHLIDRVEILSTPSMAGAERTDEDTD